MEKYICVSDSSPRRALFSRPTQKGRVYRHTNKSVPAGYRLLSFEEETDAQALCDKINKSYNDDFKPEIKTL